MTAQASVTLKSSGGTLYLVAAFDKRHHILSIGLLHTSVQAKAFARTISNATPNPMKERFDDRVQLLDSKTISCFIKSAGTAQSGDPFDDDYDLADPNYGVKIASTFLEQVKSTVNSLVTEEDGLNAVFVVADINFGFAGENMRTPFLHHHSQLEALFEGIPVKPERIKRFLVSATAEAVTESQAVFAAGEAHQHECVVAKGADASFFKEAYSGMVAQMAAEAVKKASDFGSVGPVTCLVKKSPRQAGKLLKNGLETLRGEFFSRAEEVPDEGEVWKKLRANSGAAKSYVMLPSFKVSSDKQARHVTNTAGSTGAGARRETDHRLSSPNAGSCHHLSTCCCCCASGHDTRKVHDVSQATRSIEMKR